MIDIRLVRWLANMAAEATSDARERAVQPGWTEYSRGVARGRRLAYIAAAKVLARELKGAKQ